MDYTKMVGDEPCVHCGQPTERDAWLFSALYLRDHLGGTYGPLCEECYNLIKKEERGYWI